MLKKLFYIPLFICSCSGLAFSQESLLIGAGDKLHVIVFDTPEMEQHPQVTDAGTIPLIMLGDVKVSGLTPAQASTTIQDALIQKQVMLHPHVAVTIEDNESGEVYVMGQVKDPGSYEIQTSTPIIKILALAGGLTDLGDRHIMIERKGQESQRVSYFLSNNSNKAFDENVLVHPGDTVLVPKVPIVYVIGDVARPGGYPMTTNDSQMSALQAIALAGFTNKTAIGTKTKLVRKNESGAPQEFPLNLASIQKGTIPDMDLKPDDIIFVPFSWMKNVAISSSSIAATAGGAAVYVAH
jgi:polysaccharide export outer membrane protein